MPEPNLRERLALGLPPAAVEGYVPHYQDVTLSQMQLSPDPDVRRLCEDLQHVRQDAYLQARIGGMARMEAVALRMAAEQMATDLCRRLCWAGTGHQVECIERRESLKRNPIDDLHHVRAAIELLRRTWGALDGNHDREIQDLETALAWVWA